MATSPGFFSLGEMLLGGGIDREGARLEGLDIGSKIKARQASTANALAQARLRVDEQEQREGLADAIESIGGPAEFATFIRAGVNPEQITGAMGDIQSQGFRTTISDAGVPFSERQAAAQAVEGKVVDPFQSVGTGLFADVFDPSAGVQVAPTGQANIGATQALEQERIAQAELRDEKRLHPERFKSSTTINLGTSLSEAILPGGAGESIIPKDIDAEEAFGAESFFKGGANAFLDFLGAGTPFPKEAQANAVLGELSARIQIAMRADVFRPNLQIQTLLARYAEDPRQLFRGDDLGRQNLTTTLASLKRSFGRIQDQLDSPTKKTPTRQGKLEQGLFALADTIADLEAVLESLNRTSDEADTAGAAQQVEIGAVIQLPGGGTATRIE